ncbi:hypothetical protein Cs7R123_00720 [Catellatospora sp. TT07R-123]|nr:hypothetical protein Cs7R123_00720 [Catellatospora sp. TT07R-123]
MYKEIPATLLAQLLERPDDARRVDGLLFAPGAASGWSAAASRTTLTDEQLDARFTWPGLAVSADQRHLLGGLDLGKYPDPDWFACFLAAAEDPAGIDLTGLLSPDPAEQAAAWRTATEEADLGPHHSAHQDGDSEYGFSTDTPCYGIPSYRRSEDLAAVWARIERVLAAHPRLAGRIVEQFGPEIRYYHGCAARGSADLYVCW